MAKIVVHIQEKDIENFINVLKEGGDHHITWSPFQSEKHNIQMMLTPQEFDILRLNYVDLDALPILPNNG